MSEVTSIQAQRKAKINKLFLVLCNRLDRMELDEHDLDQIKLRTNSLLASIQVKRELAKQKQYERTMSNACQETLRIEKENRQEPQADSGPGVEGTGG